jgi:hypothetical protein
MKRYYQSFTFDSATCSAPDRFMSDSAGTGRGVPSEGERSPASRSGQEPFDPPRYWEFFPGTD